MKMTDQIIPNNITSLVFLIKMYRKGIFILITYFLMNQPPNKIDKLQTQDIYNINEYTNAELLDILDLNSPSDRELEAKIIMMIEKYSNFPNQNEQLQTFFEQIYQRFFETSDNDDDYDDDDVDTNSKDENEPIVEGMTDQEQAPAPSSKISKQLAAGEQNANTKLNQTTQLSYTSGKVNPLLKETQKRMIHIDSQYRDLSIQNSTSTNYTINLSEPIINAVSIKLHSVNIPYTWYNVSNVYNTNYFKLIATTPAIQGGTYDFTFTIPPGSYNITDLVTALNTSISQVAAANPAVQFGTTNFAYSTTTLKLTYTIDIQLTVGGVTYSAQDYTLEFYNAATTNLYASNVAGVLSLKTPTWDIMLGWLMGFRSYTSYDLSPTSANNANYITANNYSINTTTDIIKMTGDTCINLFLFNNFYIILDDYTQNHLNDGLVTVTTSASDIALPSYANKYSHKKTPDGTIIPSTTSSSSNGTALTQAQTYTTNQILSNISPKTPLYSSPPYLNDMFALIPLKLSGLTPGATFSEFGGALQDNDRKYFGPVNIRRITVQLVNDRGDVVNLNGTNWSFSIVCDYLYSSSRS